MNTCRDNQASVSIIRPYSVFTMHELSSPDDNVWNQIHVVKVIVEPNRNIKHRNRQAVMSIVNALRYNTDEVYDLEPVNIGDASELKSLTQMESSSFGEYFVKLQVREGKVLIVDLSLGKPHAS